MKTVVFHTDGTSEVVPEPIMSASDLNAYAVRRRWDAEVAGILFDGNPIPTDDRAKGLVSGAYQKAIQDPTATKLWQTSNDPLTFVTFTNAQLRALGVALDAFVQSTFDALGAVSAGITDGTITTTDQIDAAFASLTRVFTSA